MGWWKVEGTQNLIGDAPLDTLSAAVCRVVADYQSSFGRLPTKAEWETLLEAVLGVEVDGRHFSDEGAVKRVVIQLG